MRFVFIISGKRCDCDCGVTTMAEDSLPSGRERKWLIVVLGKKLEKGLPYILHE